MSDLRSTERQMAEAIGRRAAESVLSTSWAWWAGTFIAVMVITSVMVRVL